MGRFTKFIVKLFTKLATEAPHRLDVSAIAKKKGLPANRTFVIQFTDDPSKALYMGFENGHPACSMTPRYYHARIVMSVSTILEILDEKMDFDQGYAWGHVKVIPSDPKEFTAYDIQLGRELLTAFSDTIRKIALG